MGDRNNPFILPPQDEDMNTNPFDSEPAYYEQNKPLSSQGYDTYESRPTSFAAQAQPTSFAEQEPAPPQPAAAATKGPVPPGTKNWPPCRPIIYHSIRDEIDIQHQSLVRQLYFSWYLTIFCLLLNMIGCLCILIAGITGKDFGFSIMYFFVVTPLSFILWYRPIYNAFMKDRSLYFWMFFFFNGFHIAFCFYCWLGLQDTGGAGMINLVLLFQRGYAPEGIVCVIAMLGWTVATIDSLYLFIRVLRHYRSKGHTLAAARNEAVSGAMNSDAGRQAVTSVGTAAANSAINHYSSGYDQA